MDAIPIDWNSSNWTGKGPAVVRRSREWEMSMQEIDCIALDGTIKKIAKDRLILRPAAYALIVQEGKLLLLKMRHNGKYHLPGGGIHIGERMQETLKREVREETGMEISVGQFLRFEEVFFYYDPSGKAYHGLHFYFICRSKTLKLPADEEVDDESAEQPRWVEIHSLHPEEFQILGEVIMNLCRQADAQFAEQAD